MLIRISLIIAIIAGLAAGALNFVKVKEKITGIRAERDEWHQKHDATFAELTTTKKELDTTKTDLTQTKEALETTTSQRDKAVADLGVATRRGTQLAEELEVTKKQKDEALILVSRYQASGLTPEQALAAAQEIKRLEGAVLTFDTENKLLNRTKEKLEYELGKYRGSNVIVYLPATLNGRVITSDPKWDFVILNVGENQGVKEDGQFLVSRNGKLVAKVIVRSVEQDRSIANVMPGWKLGELLEGDQVIPAHPGS
jgi:hypothetical protein